MPTNNEREQMICHMKTTGTKTALFKKGSCLYLAKLEALDDPDVGTWDRFNVEKLPLPVLLDS